MQRTNKPDSKKAHLPDFINNSVSRDFVQVPNEMLRCPTLSAKAKTILCLLLSHREGWDSNVESIYNHMKEGYNAVENGMKELEEHGYMLRLRYRNSDTKKYAGSLWIYTNTPRQLSGIENTLRTIYANHFELDNKSGQRLLVFLDKTHVLKIRIWESGCDNQDVGLMYYINNIKILNKNIKSSLSELHKLDLDDSDLDDEKLQESSQTDLPTDQRAKQYLPTARYLSHIIQKEKNIRYTAHQLKAWSHDIRKLVELNHVSHRRIKDALKWYSDHIGETYVPVIESGATLRDKFVRLEAAIQRGSNGSSKPKSKNEKKWSPNFDQNIITTEELMQQNQQNRNN